MIYRKVKLCTCAHDADIYTPQVGDLITFTRTELNTVLVVDSVDFDSGGFLIIIARVLSGRITSSLNTVCTGQITKINPLILLAGAHDIS